MKREVKLLNFIGQLFFIGIDVHKKSWKITIRLNNMVLKTFSMNPDPQQLAHYLKTNYPGGIYFSVYEAGFCGFWIHKRLIALGIKNIVVNAADIPTRSKERDRKSDAIDSRKLARELENNSLESIYIPSDDELAFRSVARSYFLVSKELTRVKTRIKSFLNLYGIEIVDNSEISHWSKRFITWLWEKKFTDEKLTFSYHVLLKELEKIRNEKLEVMRYMRKLTKGHKIITLLRTVPGIGFIVSFVLYAEIMNIKRFGNADKLASFIGIVPSMQGSGEKEKVKGLTKRNNKFLRNLIIEAAWIAIRNDPAMTMAYSEYLKKMESKKAVIRITRKLINRIRYVWTNEKSYVKGVVA